MSGSSASKPDDGTPKTRVTADVETKVVKDETTVERVEETHTEAAPTGAKPVRSSETDAPPRRNTPWKNIIIVLLIAALLLTNGGMYWQWTNIQHAALTQAAADKAQALLEAEERRLADLKEQEAILQENLDYVYGQVGYLKEHISSLRADIQRLDAAYTHAIAALKEALRTNEGYKVELASLKEKLATETGRLAAANAEKAGMLAKMDNLERTIRGQQSQIAGMQGQVGALQGQLADANKATKGLMGWGLLGGLL